MEKKREASVKKNGNVATAALDPVDLKASVDLVSFLESQGIAFTRHGTTLMGLCPFHQDTKPSLSVTPGKHLWHCFGCDAGGDVITFLQKKENLSFQEALIRLQEWQGRGSGVGAQGSGKSPSENSRKPSGNGGKTKPTHSSSTLNPAQVFQRVVEFYHQSFREDPRGVQYLQSRGLHDRELFFAFQVGFANGTLLSTIPKDGELKAVLMRLGILNDKGNEFFHNCVIFPLTNEDGQVLGMYGRSIDPEAAVPHRYLPGPRAGLFNGSAAKRSQELILTESVPDALALIQGGFPNTIPLYGTNGLTEDHLVAFAKHNTQTIRLCLDSDQAGREAVPKIAERLQVRGIQVLDIVLPEKDPVDFFQKHTAAEFQTALEEAGQVSPAVPTGGRVESPDPNPRPLAPDFLSSFVETKPATDPGESPDTFTKTLGGVTYQIRKFSILSDQMRVHLKATCGEKSHRDTLDLYSNRARQTVVNHLVRKFGIQRTDLEGHLLQLLEALEKTQETPKETATASDPPKPSDLEAEAALEFLRSPDLVDLILSDMETLGYVGEDHNKLLAYLIGISRKLPQPLSGIMISQSGAGKSQLAERIEELTPPEDVIHFSRLSPQALAYMERDALKRKLLIFEERAGSEAADYSIRILQSRSKISQAVVLKDPQSGKMYTKTNTVEGPAAFLETTTKPTINHENATRCFLLYLNESQEQTQKIQALQKQQKTLDGFLQNTQSEIILKRHHNAQRLLKMVHVVIPYAPLIEFPTEWIRTRRDHARFLCLIEAVAFLHQAQRQIQKIGDQEYIEAGLSDYRIAYHLAREILGYTLNELGKAPKELLWEIEAMVTHCASEKHKSSSEVVFTRRQLREWCHWPDYKIKDCVKVLVDLEYLAVVSATFGTPYTYHLIVEDSKEHPFLLGLTTPEELEAKLCEALIHS